MINLDEKCIICFEKLKIKFFREFQKKSSSKYGYNISSVMKYSLSGSLKKKEDNYEITFSNKSKTHSIILDKNLKITKNTSGFKKITLCKYCPECNPYKFLESPQTSLSLLNENGNYCKFQIHSGKISIIESCIRVRQNNITYLLHSAFDIKRNIWRTHMMIADRSKSIDGVFSRHTEENEIPSFKTVEDMVEKLSMYQVFS